MPLLAEFRLALIVTTAGLMAFACWHDLATRKLPDGVAIAIALAGVAWQLAAGHLGWSLLAAATVFSGGAAIWYLGALGGGDVKLLAAAALLPQAGAVPMLLLLTALAGGLLASAYVIGHRLQPTVPPRPTGRLARIWRAERWRIRRGGPLPYALAITCGTLISVLDRT